ncbi:YbaK/EbsC family protein [uncultured Alcanivorax sp.]|jgi:Ala-tRNA(Pro) deacylase|uniref:aminoacyl-tRNA deacylase n=1 Tax=uncultured Alcanivorax sp. TaxID=191215 RepID=UPI002589FCD4|nr:YbaK/EbsC family protein [uncultured Alcanivorax sp.]
MPARALADFLDNNKVSYHCYNHAPAVTASEVAQSAHIPSRNMAKPVIVEADGELVMAVLPANHYLDPNKLRQALNANHVNLANEDHFKGRFPLCEPGGEPPFGNLYGMKVYVDNTLLSEDWLAFNAGTHTEVITMGMGDFLRLSQAQACAFAMLH